MDSTVDNSKSVKISVIIATYEGDSAEYLQDSVASISKQTMPDFELILSVDGPVSVQREELLNEFSLKDSRIKILWNPVNRGPAATRNTAIKTARGKYIAILDSDDIAVPSRLEKQIAILEEENVDLVGSAYIEFDNFEDKDGFQVRTLPISHNEIVTRVSFSCPIANPTILVKRWVLQKFHYREDFRVGEDYALWITLLKNGIQMYNTQEPLVYYRRGANFLDRRSGFKYARTDFINKISTLTLVPKYNIPIVFCNAIVSFFVRLAPPRIFKIARDLLHKKVVV